MHRYMRFNAKYPVQSIDVLNPVDISDSSTQSCQLRANILDLAQNSQRVRVDHGSIIIDVVTGIIILSNRIDHILVNYVTVNLERYTFWCYKDVMANIVHNHSSICHEVLR